MRRVLADRNLEKAVVGVKIVRLGASPAQVQTRFEHQASRPLIPASNMKLITTSAALERLGGEFQFRTLLVQRGRDLVIVGDGDPTFGDAELFREFNWQFDGVFPRWAQLLRERNITSGGNIIVDDSVFDQQFIHPSWPENQQDKRYVAQVGGLSFNGNCVEFYLRTRGFGEVVSYRTFPETSYFRVSNSCVFGNENKIVLARRRGTNELILGGQASASNSKAYFVTINDPALFAGHALADALRAHGVSIGGTVQRDRTIRAMLSQSHQQQPPLNVLVIHQTPLATVLAGANKFSTNLYAEALAKRLGHAVSGESGSWDNGSAAIGEYLRSLGVPSSEFTIDDASGLSKKNAISANAITTVLTRDFHGPNRETFLHSLAVGGEDGTLGRRFQNDLRGRVFAKSGYVAGVFALSGYVRTTNNDWYAFAILMNNTHTNAAKDLQERIVRAIDQNAR